MKGPFRSFLLSIALNAQTGTRTNSPAMQAYDGEAGIGRSQAWAIGWCNLRTVLLECAAVALVNECAAGS